MTLHRTITLASALVATGLAVALAVASAAGRAASPHAVALLAALSAAVVLAAHLAPALLRSVPKSVLWPTWSLCLAGALWAHASFLSAAGREAAAAQLASSPAAVARAAQRADLEQALGSIKARPTTQIARQIPSTTDPARLEALRIELGEAKRADVLRQQLVALSAATAAAAAAATSDPWTSTLAGALGVSADALAMTISLLLAFLLELIGMLLWREVFGTARAPVQLPEPISTPAQPAAPAAQAAVHQVLQVNVHPTASAAAHLVQGAMQPAVPQIEQASTLYDDRDLDTVRRAIARGDCNKTVESIRTYLACSSSKARSLRRAVLDT